MNELHSGNFQHLTILFLLRFFWHFFFSISKLQNHFIQNLEIYLSQLIELFLGFFISVNEWRTHFGLTFFFSKKLAKFSQRAVNRSEEHVSIGGRSSFLVF